MKRLRLDLIVAVGLLLVGCGKHYWSKAGSGPEDFQRESMECARENSAQMTANKDYGIVIADLYKMCLRARGWNRAQQLDPPPAGWYEGSKRTSRCDSARRPRRLDPRHHRRRLVPRRRHRRRNSRSRGRMRRAHGS
jgi:hypothetical protein